MHSLCLIYFSMSTGSATSVKLLLFSSHVATSTGWVFEKLPPHKAYRLSIVLFEGFCDTFKMKKPRNKTGNFAISTRICDISRFSSHLRNPGSLPFFLFEKEAEDRGEGVSWIGLYRMAEDLWSISRDQQVLQVSSACQVWHEMRKLRNLSLLMMR